MEIACVFGGVWMLLVLLDAFTTAVVGGIMN